MIDPAIPTPAEREALNAALPATGTETGFWDDDGRPAPRPDNIDQRQPTTSEPATGKPGEQPILAREPWKIRRHTMPPAGPHALLGVIYAG